MAVIDPADLPPGDTRPIYNRDVLPGGPWNQYRPRGWVNAHLITGRWLLQRPDGMLVEREGPEWAVQNPSTLDLALMSVVEFDAQYRPVEG